MATPYSWPSTLPKPQKQFKIKQVDGLLSDTDDLYPERNRSLPEFDGFFSFILTDSQYSAFETFYKNTLNGGCAAFVAGWIADVLNDSSYVARFKEPYAASFLGGGKWSASVSLELFVESVEE